MGNIQTLEDLLGMLRRRAILLVAISVAGVFATVIYALSLPKTYEAAAVIQIEIPQVDVSSQSAGSSSASVMSRQVQLIEQRLMSRENVQRVIDDLGLFHDMPELTDSQKIFLLRTATKIETISAASAGYGGDSMLSALVISASLGDPVQVAQLANELADQVLTQNARDQAARRTDALAFFETEESRIAEEIAGIEAEIAAFQGANLEALPGSIANRRQEIDILRTEIRAIDQRVVELDSERRLSQSGGQIREVDRRQIVVLDDQIAVMDEQKSALADRIAVVLEIIDRAPEVDRVLSAYARRQQLLQERYNVVTRRRAEAETSQRLAENQQGERFELLEPAIIPDYAVSSSRRKIAAAGGVASVGLAFAVALLLELLNPVLRTPGQVQRQTGLVPVISIPYIETAAEYARRRRFNRVATVILLSFGLLMAMGMIGAYAVAALVG